MRPPAWPLGRRADRLLLHPVHCRLFVLIGMLAVPIFIAQFVKRSFFWLAGIWSITITGSAVLRAMHSLFVVSLPRQGDDV